MKNNGTTSCSRGLFPVVALLYTFCERAIYLTCLMERRGKRSARECKHFGYKKQISDSLLSVNEFEVIFDVQLLYNFIWSWYIGNGIFVYKDMDNALENNA